MAYKLHLPLKWIFTFPMGAIFIWSSGCVPATSRLVYSPSSTTTTDPDHFIGTHPGSGISSSAQTLTGGNYQLIGTVSGTQGEASLTGGTYKLKLSRKEK